MKFYILQTGT